MGYYYHRHDCKNLILVVEGKETSSNGDDHGCLFTKRNFYKIKLQKLSGFKEIL